MKISNEVFRYIEGEMDADERASFEKKIEHSGELKEQIASYNNLVLKVQEAARVKADEDYFISIIPRFRLMLENKKKKKLVPMYAGLAAVVSAVILFFLLTSQPQVETTEAETELFSVVEAETVLMQSPYYSISIDSLIKEIPESIDILDNQLVTELDLDEDGMEAFSSYVYTASDISADEADLVYEQIINKSFF